MTENNNPSDLAKNVLHTLRWYLAEQKCLAEDNWSLYYEFSSIFPPSPTVSCLSPMPTVHEHRFPMTIEQLLQWLSQIFNTKSLLVEAYKEYFYKNTPAATGKVRFDHSSNLHGDIAQTLRDFVTRQEPYVQAVRESANAIFRTAPSTAATPVARHVQRYANPPAITHAYVERFLERLMDNLDAEHSLDTAHVAYCTLVYQPRIRLAADVQRPTGQRRFWFAPATVHDGRSQEKGGPRCPKPFQVQLMYANELPPGTIMSIVQRGNVQQGQGQPQEQRGTSGIGPRRL